MKSYKTISRKDVFELEIEKSQFIAYAIPTKSVEEALGFFDETRKRHKDSTHVVIAYLIGESFEHQKYSDDGEPHGTAGMPILSMLKNEAVTNVAVAVVRYFGGVKLGTGGLARAYTAAAKGVVEKAGVAEMRPFCNFKVLVDYNLHGKLANYIENSENVLLDDTVFLENVSLHLSCETKYFDEVKNEITNLSNGKAEISDIEEVERAAV